MTSFRQVIAELDSIEESGPLWDLACEIAARPPSTEPVEEWAKRLAAEMVAFGEAHDHG